MKPIRKGKSTMKKFFSILLSMVLLLGTVSFTGTQAQAVTFNSSAMDFAADMKIGWNLGNSLDAYDLSGGNETAWNNPVVTQSLIQLVKAQGFNTIRIPVTYMNRIGAAPDYTIETAWLNRVQEVVDYVINEGLYAIIDIQADANHDTAYGAWLHIDDADQTTVRAKFESVWDQIATRFRDYDEKLIFESANELMEQGNYGTPADPDTYDNINTLNQIFVNTVRATGSNNAQRFLIVPGYNTDIYSTAVFQGFELPTDTATDKLMVSVHFYDPYDFTLNESNDTIFAWGQTAINAGSPNAVTWHAESGVQTSMGYIENAFTNNGIPVIFGEFGAVDKSFVDSSNSEYRRYYYEYVTKAITEAGGVAICWDNGWTGNYGLALFDRTTNTVTQQDIIDGMMRASSGTSYVIDQPQISTSAELTVEFYNGNRSAQTNSIVPVFKLTNTGTGNLSLEDVTLHYYYTKDGTQQQNFWCDWSSVGSANVSGTFVPLSPATATADTYLEISFTSAAGSLGTGQSAYVQARFAKSDWSSYTQTNDYSFNSSDTTYVSWDYVTSYISGDLNSGIEP